MSTAQDQQSRAELLPCPFCGGTEILVKKKKTTMIECKACGALVFNYQDGVERDAFAAWNRRAPAAQAARALPADPLQEPDEPAGYIEATGERYYTAAQVQAMLEQGGGPACPFPCGWESLHKLAVAEGAYLANNLLEGEPVTDKQRDTVMRVVLRGIETVRAVLAAAPRPPAAQDRKTVACACGDEFPIDSYGGGFLDAKGKCFGCDAADEAAHGIKEGGSNAG